MTRSLALVLAALLVPVAARADRRELYTSVEVSPSLLRLTDPVTERYSTTAGAVGGALTVAYGLTNAIHIGGALHYAQGSDAAFPNARVVLIDGSSSAGAVFENVTSMGASLFGLYRFHTRSAMSPVVQADVGFSTVTYSNVLHIPSGAGYGVGFPTVHELAVEIRASARLEYRFGDNLVAGAGAGVLMSPGALRPLGFYFPMSVGWIW